MSDKDSLLADAEGAAVKALTTEPADDERARRADRAASLWSDAWRDLRRNPIFLVSTVMISLLLLLAVFPQWFATVDPFDAATCDLGKARMVPGGEGGLFGRDNLGCDVYSRTVYGTRNSIVVGLVTSVLAALIGGITGMVAGYFGRATDTVISRVAEFFFALPLILGGLLILSIFRTGSVWTVALVLATLAWPMTFRIMRSAVITAKSADYVVAARALGAGHGRIMVRHILPNALAPVIVVATINLGVYIAAEAALSYLGIGIQSPEISWGLMISDAQQWFTSAAHPLLFPAAFLSVTVLSFILLGDAVRDALDPKLR